MYKEAFVNKGLHNLDLFYYDKTDSTNTRAKLFALSRSAEDVSSAVFLTRAQSAGRGTRGRLFESPEDGGLYLSLLLYPKLHAKDAHLLTCAAAVAVCRAVETTCTGIKPKIKWVNDVYVKGRKLCGILTEGECDERGQLRYAIIGIGVNLKKAPHTPEVEAIMTSLEDEGFAIAPTTIAAEIVSELLSLISDGVAVLDEYRRRSMLIGKEVEITSGGITVTERVIDIDGECALITEDESKNIKRYISGDVKMRPKKEDK